MYPSFEASSTQTINGPAYSVFRCATPDKLFLHTPEATDRALLPGLTLIHTSFAFQRMQETTLYPMLAAVGPRDSGRAT